MNQERREFIPDPNKFVGILPDWKIKEYIKSGKIRIIPLPEAEELDQLLDDPYGPLGPVTFDFCLGPIIKYLDTTNLAMVDPRKPSDNLYKTHDMSTTNNEFMMHPGQFLLAESVEWLELPADIVGHLDGKSSLGRFGLAVHSTAPRFDPGWKGKIRFELKNNLPDAGQPLYTGMRIAAMEFIELAAPVDIPYHKRESAKYKNQGSVDVSRSHLEFPSGHPN